MQYTARPIFKAKLQKWVPFQNHFHCMLWEDYVTKNHRKHFLAWDKNVFIHKNSKMYCKQSQKPSNSLLRLKISPCFGATPKTSRTFHEYFRSLKYYKINKSTKTMQEKPLKSLTKCIL